MDIFDIMSLKNTSRAESTAMHHSDHTIWLNGLILKQVLKDGEIYLFNPPEVPNLFKLFYSDNTEAFEAEYERCINNPNIRKIKVKAREYMLNLVSERASTHRIYIAFADNANKQSMYDVNKYSIRMTNLCILQCTIG